MLAPSGNMRSLASIARRHPTLPIIIDHMGALVHKTEAEAFSQIDHVLALGKLSNVAVKATCLPGYSAEDYPWPDVSPYVERLFQSVGAGRLFWGSDLSRLPRPYGLLVEIFRDGFPWLGAATKIWYLARHAGRAGLVIGARSSWHPAF